MPDVSPLQAYRRISEIAESDATAKLACSEIDRYRAALKRVMRAETLDQAVRIAFEGLVGESVDD